MRTLIWLGCCVLAYVLGAVTGLIIYLRGYLW